MLVSIALIAPFVMSVFLSFLYIIKPRPSQKVFAFFGVSAPFISAVCLGVALFSWNGEIINQDAFTWISAGIFKIVFGYYVDKLSLYMGFFVAFLGLLIHIYSIGYMDKDSGFGKFFVYMNLFLGSMFVLVLANSPLFMFLGWEGVGACSYLLISFYFTKDENVKAGNKAFIMNRIGDFGFLLGLISLYLAVGTNGFDYVNLNEFGKTILPDFAVFIGICFLCGALAKSAQIPLYTWLPDAMAGPTPISALIHAATMVTAGVYMVLRFDFLYAGLDSVLNLFAYIGAASAIFAAIIATKATDIKKILAYSTMSQLGYMFVGLAYAKSASLFHLFTHGFFKALLFLGAGAVIIALHHEQNIFKMGGLKNQKVLFYPMLIGALAICGIFPLSGFFSKDALIIGAFTSGHYILGLILLVTAGLTAYYMFRLIFLVFFSQNVSDEVHKVPFSMKFVNFVLMILAIFGGVVGLFLDLPHESLKTELIGAFVSLAVALGGIFVAYKKFYNYKNHEVKENSISILVSNKFYIDEIYEFFFVKSIKFTSILIREFIDAIVLSLIVNLNNLFIKSFSKFFAKITQNGKANSYVFYMVLTIFLGMVFLKVSL